IFQYPVTISAFRRYTQDKPRFRTTADLNGFSYVFTKILVDDSEIFDVESDEVDEGLIGVANARWNRPEGGFSQITNRLNHPVTHVSFDDAQAYCAWKGMRLPTEIEWEYAARGGLDGVAYPWGDMWELRRTNLWQGTFPDDNQLRDGQYGIASVEEYGPQNDYEIYDMLGNVWEWTLTRFRNLSHPMEEDDQERYTVKGGSFLDTRDGDAKSDGIQVRISARKGHRRSYTAYNLGFRCCQSMELPEKPVTLPQYKVVRLRPPVHHHTPEKHEHISHTDEL
ncbi:unnamed protein product, partial [Didymodactylos carnosus]